eukprot:jgi/Botrbrau1/18052/Bobra.0062s0040.1
MNARHCYICVLLTHTGNFKEIKFVWGFDANSFLQVGTIPVVANFGPKCVTSFGEICYCR